MKNGSIGFEKGSMRSRDQKKEIYTMEVPYPDQFNSIC